MFIHFREEDFKEKDISMSYYDDVDTADGTGRDYDPFEEYEGYDVYEGYDDILESRKKRSVKEGTA